MTTYAETKISRLVEDLDSKSRIVEIQAREIEALRVTIRHLKHSIRAYHGTVTKLTGRKPRRAAGQLRARATAHQLQLSI